MADRYARIIHAAMTTPWAITPEKAMIIRDILQFRAAGGRLTAEEVRARIGAAADDERPKPRQSGLVAVIPIWGVIAHRTFDASSGMTSAESISAWLRKAVNDEEVSSIILDVSSPGGTVDGVPELVAEVFAARKVKPVYAIANAMAASAAYWIGSQATELSMIPSGLVGSIGVYMLTEDWSEYLAKEGIKFNPISAGDLKLEGAWWEPLSDDARAHYQAQVDTIYADFLKAVARGRNTTVANVKKTFGQGRSFDAAEALARGMVDQIETFDQLVARVTGGGKRRGSARAEVSTPISATSETAPPDGVATPATGMIAQTTDGLGNTGTTTTSAGGSAHAIQVTVPSTGSLSSSGSATSAPQPAAPPPDDARAAADRDLLEIARAR